MWLERRVAKKFAWKNFNKKKKNQKINKKKICNAIK